MFFLGFYPKALFFHKILPMFAEYSNSFAKSTSCKGLDMKQKERKLPYYINKDNLCSHQFLHTFRNPFICFSYLTCIKCRQVNACHFLGRMPQGLANDSDRYPKMISRRCPAMTENIGRQLCR